MKRYRNLIGAVLFASTLFYKCTGGPHPKSIAIQFSVFDQGADTSLLGNSFFLNTYNVDSIKIFNMAYNEIPIGKKIENDIYTFMLVDDLQDNTDNIYYIRLDNTDTDTINLSLYNNNNKLKVYQNSQVIFNIDKPFDGIKKVKLLK